MSRTNWATQEMFNWAANDGQPYQDLITLAEMCAEGDYTKAEYLEEVEKYMRISQYLQKARESILGEGDSLDDINYEELAYDFAEDIVNLDRR